MSLSFSGRHGYQPPDAEITIREDAPAELREAVLVLAKKQGMTPTDIRRAVCDVLLKVPDPQNWSDYPNVWNEVIRYMEECRWPKVYDIAERLYKACRDSEFEESCAFDEEEFSDAINQFFREHGIGWQMERGEIVFRGSEAFAIATDNAASALSESGRPRAADEIQKSLQSLSIRPKPDLTAAVTHAMGALESIARDLTGQPQPTFGQLSAKLDLPKPLDTAVEKLWGYSSGYARHIQEGRAVAPEEAELVVTVSAATCTFLAKRSPS